MNATRKLAIVALVALLGGCVVGGPLSAAQTQDTAGKQPSYTVPEYNAYKAACDEKNPQQQIRLLDDFAQKYPSSALLGYVYQCYLRNYYAQKNYPKVMEYADKIAALGDKADANMRYEAYYARAVAFNNTNIPANDPAAKEKGVKAREAALAGLKALAEVKKPDSMSQEDFDQHVVLPAKIQFNYAAATAAMAAKDFPGAVESYKAIIALTPNEPVAWFRLGVAYLSTTPPQHLDGFWAVARSVALKGPTEAQVRKYLRSQMFNYQQPGCETLLDAELNELVTLAGSSAERPESYKLPSSADLDAARKDMTILSVITDLKAGGDKGKVTWLASCGSEFPDVPGKVLEVTPGTDAVVLKTAFVTSDEEFQAATTPNMEVRIVGQPQASRIEKNSLVQFTGTLAAYDPEPNFMLHWDKAKVKPENIPEEKKKAAPKRPTRRPAARKPSG